MKLTKTNNTVPPHRAMYSDRGCEYMAMLGFSNRAIRSHIGLSDSQIQKKLKSAGIKRVDYRDGVNPIGRAVIQRLDHLAEKRLIQHIERHLLK